MKNNTVNFNALIRADINVTRRSHGKVGDIFEIVKDGDEYIIIVRSNRISAFDHVFEKTIPNKGAVLTGISSFFLSDVQERKIVPTWYVSNPHPQVIIGELATPFKIEVILRQYITGSLWRLYQKGMRKAWGYIFPDGLQDGDKLEEVIITPTTKAKEGHDLDITEEEIISQGFATESEWETIKEYSFKLFDHATRLTKRRGLILVDTKYEFGKLDNGNIVVIDEINTPDSSRYFLQKDYDVSRVEKRSPRSLSKEFFREWLIAQNYQNRPDDVVPIVPDSKIEEISSLYTNLYQQVTGTHFQKYLLSFEDISIEESIINAIEKL